MRAAWLGLTDQAIVQMVAQPMLLVAFLAALGSMAPPRRETKSASNDLLASGAQMINHLATLGLSRLPSSAEELQSAYRSKARSTHPDNGGSSEKFVAVRAAYDTLRDPVKLQS